jgi:hypothetical protein
MAARTLVDRMLSPAGLGLALLMFLLPFLTVSCDDSSQSPTVGYVGTFTGVNLVTGGAPDITSTTTEDGGTQTVNLPAEAITELERDSGLGEPVQPLAVVAAIVIFAGMILTLVAPMHLRVRIGAAAALAAVVLLVTEVVAVAPQVVAQAQAQHGDPTDAARTRPAIGFYLAVGILLAVSARELVRARRPLAPDDSEPLGPDALEAEADAYEPEADALTDPR